MTKQMLEPKWLLMLLLLLFLFGTEAVTVLRRMALPEELRPPTRAQQPRCALAVDARDEA